MSSPSTNPAWGLYERLMPTEIEAIFDQHPIAYLPWGALEYHGKHASVGLDSLKAQGLCVKLAQQAGGLVIPTVNVAANTMKTVPDIKHTRHSLNFSEELLRLLAKEYLEQLAEEKFRIVFTLCGHVGQPHYDIIKEEAKKFNQSQSSTRIIATSETDLISEDIVVVNHAALGEVSFLMHTDPDCVDLSRLPQDRVPTLEDDAVWGPDPRESSADKGRAYTEAFLEGAQKLIADTLAQN